MEENDWFWNLSGKEFSGTKGKVFSCFSCGGGSSMGYKLAGFEVIGNCEIDPRVNALYKKNLNPKYSFEMSIRELVMLPELELPDELFELDILDGSPPCSSFSTIGQRDRYWGVEKAFREGQAVQVLDTLFFDFIALARRLRPKVVVAENVPGILIGDAKIYADQIRQDLEDAGYHLAIREVRASDCGVPQSRPRVFFVAVRADLGDHLTKVLNLFSREPRIDLEFSEPHVPFRMVRERNTCEPKMFNGEKHLKRFQMWENRIPTDYSFGDISERMFGSCAGFSNRFYKDDEVAPTLTAGSWDCLYDEFRDATRSEQCSMSTFPQDYDFGDQKPRYICGMSVPPLMMKRIAERVYDQLISKFGL